MEGFSNSVVIDTNPAIHVLEEARELYGTEKRISCLVSLGTGLSNEPLRDWKLPEKLTENYSKLLQETAMSVDAIDAKIKTMIQHGSYYRFDPTSEVNHLYSTNPEAWIKAVAFDQTSSLEPFLEAVERYVKDDDVSRMAKECATRLHRPMRRNSMRSWSGNSTASSLSGNSVTRTWSALSRLSIDRSDATVTAGT